MARRDEHKQKMPIFIVKYYTGDPTKLAKRISTKASFISTKEALHDCKTKALIPELPTINQTESASKKGITISVRPFVGDITSLPTNIIISQAAYAKIIKKFGEALAEKSKGSASSIPEISPIIVNLRKIQRKEIKALQAQADTCHR